MAAVTAGCRDGESASDMTKLRSSRHLLVRVALPSALVALTLVGCGEDSGTSTTPAPAPAPAPPPPPPNRAPVVETEINDATLAPGNEGTLNLEEAPPTFSDPDGDRLTYSATSSNHNVATATVNGTVLSVVAVGAGEAEIRVTATDPGGLSVSLSFTVTVTGGDTGGTSGVITTYAGPCRVGMVLGPGGSCSVLGDRFEVLADGRGRFAFITAGTGITLNAFRATRIPGTDNWRIEGLP